MRLLLDIIPSSEECKTYKLRRNLQAIFIPHTRTLCDRNILTNTLFDGRPFHQKLASIVKSTGRNTKSPHFFVWRLFMQLSNLRVNFYVNKIKVFPQIWRLLKSPHKKILHFSLLHPFEWNKESYSLVSYLWKNY